MENNDQILSEHIRLQASVQIDWKASLAFGLKKKTSKSVVTDIRLIRAAIKNIDVPGVTWVSIATGDLMDSVSPS